MLFKYYIQHDGQTENTGYGVSATHEEIMNIAKDRFSGWAVGSCAGAVPIKDMTPKKSDVIDSDLGWIHPMFAKL